MKITSPRRFWAFSALWLGLLVALVPPVPKLRESLDVQVFHAAGVKAWAGQTVYDVVGHYQFKYWPVMSLAFGATISQLDFASATLAFYGLSYLAWVMLLLVVARQTLREFDCDSRVRVWAAVGFGGLAYFATALADELRFGQINGLALAALFGFFDYSVDQGRDRKTVTVRAIAPHRGHAIFAGVCLALAVTAKLPALAALPFAVFRRQWLVLGSFAVALIFINFGLPTLIWGFDHTLAETLAWIATLAKSSAELMYSLDNISLLGTLGRWLGAALRAAYVGRALQLLWLATGIAYTFLAYRLRFASPMVRLAATSLAILVLTPLVWSYWILLGAPVFFVLVARLAQSPILRLRYKTPRGRIALGAAVFILIAFNLQRSELARGYLLFPAIAALGALYLLIGTQISSSEPSTSGASGASGLNLAP